jgi:hypothetical protein
VLVGRFPGVDGSACSRGVGRPCGRYSAMTPPSRDWCLGPGAPRRPRIGTNRGAWHTRRAARRSRRPSTAARGRACPMRQSGLPVHGECPASRPSRYPRAAKRANGAVALLLDNDGEVLRHHPAFLSIRGARQVPASFVVWTDTVTTRPLSGTATHHQRRFTIRRAPSGACGVRASTGATPRTRDSPDLGR